MRRKWGQVQFFGAAMVACLLPACTAPLARSVPESELRASGRYDLIQQIDVPCVEGVEGCGAQALAAAMAFRDDELDAESLGAELPWHDYGATPVDLLIESRNREFTATIERGTWARLSELIADDQPALVMFDAAVHVKSWLAKVFPPPRVMHWGVVSGVAIDDSRVLIAAPESRHHVIGRDEFLKRWAESDYCTIIVRRPPSGGRRPPRTSTARETQRGF